ncbi:MAG: hypothetical protein ACXVGB_13870, partial [Mycobacteriaceae bacterium]
ADISPKARPLPDGLNDDQGWFEIKSMARVRLAIEELHSYYLPRWNDNLKVIHEDWLSEPGVGQPVSMFVTPNKGSSTFRVGYAGAGPALSLPATR